MASNSVYEEALRLVLEVTGEEGAERLRAALEHIGEVSAETVGETSKLLESLQGLNQAASDAASYEALSSQLGDLEVRFAENQRAALQLSLAISDSEKPAAGLVREQRRLSEEGVRLQASLKQQWEELQRLDTRLATAGHDTSNLSALQASLRNEMGRASDAIERQAQAIDSEAKAQRQLSQRYEDSDDAMRRQAKTSRDAAASLAAYRERSAEAAEGTRDLAQSSQVAATVMARLKTIAATAFSFVGFGKLIDGIKSIVKEGSDAEQEVAQLEAAIASAGRQAEFTADSLRKMADQMDAGLFDDGQIAAAQTRLLSYTNVLGERFPAALQITIDQAQRLGISLESSAETIGKALQTPSKAMESLSKQGFTLDAAQKDLIKSLEATGQVAQAQAVILDMLNESYGGAAAAAKLGTAAGLWKQITDRYKGFKQEISDRGVMSYFKGQMDELLRTLDRMAADGSLSRWAQATANAIISVSEVAKGATQWIIEHRDGLIGLAKAYAAFKVGQALVGLNNWRIGLVAATRAQMANAAAMAAAERSATLLGTAVRRIPAALAIAIAIEGSQYAIKYLKDLGEWLGKNSEAAKVAEDAMARLNASFMENAQGYADAARSMEQYAHVQLLTAEQVAKLGDVERADYEARLAGLRQYQVQVDMYYFSMREGGALTKELADKAALHAAAIERTREGMVALAEGSRLAADALRNGVSAAAQAVIDTLDGVGSNARVAREQLSELFKGLNYEDQGSLGAVATALAAISGESARAARNVREGLGAELSRLTSQELLNFQTAAGSAFDQFKTGPQEAAAVLDSTLVAALTRLGVSAERMGVKFTDSGREASLAFQTILENANATGAQIETAFKAALANVSTLDEAKQLGVILGAAGKQGKLGFDQAARSASALNARLREIKVALDPLTDEFSRLGIQSQASLNAARDSAKDAFEAIRKGAAQGKAGIEDVRRAYRAYAETARASVADSDASAKARVDAELSVLDATYRVADALDDAGERGAAATQAIASGAGDAAAELDGVAAAAGNAATATSAAGQAAGGFAKQAGSAGTAAQSMAFGIGEISEKAKKLMAFSGQWNPLANFAAQLNKLTDQRKQLAEYNSELQKTMEGFDELKGRRESLEQKFDMVGASEIEQTLQLEQQVSQKRAEVARKAREDEQQRLQLAKQRREEEEAAERARIGGDSRNAKPQEIIVDFRAPSASVVASATAAERATAERVAALAAPLVLRQIEKSRGVSLRRSSRA